MKDTKLLLDDLLAFGGHALESLMNARGEWKGQSQKCKDAVTRKFDLVSREEFDAAFAMLAKSRAMQDELSERLSRIEKHLNMGIIRKSAGAVKKKKPK
jgi:BMFP domain-containing protein YqiC